MVLRQSAAAVAGCPVEILGVDASRTALRAARRGVYPAPCVAGVPPACLAAYFAAQRGVFTVVPPVREMVTFLHHDIRSGFYLGKFDVIFCCNLLLYYLPRLRRRILDGLAASLRPGGVLFLGHAEGITPPTDRFEPVPCRGGFVYRRA
jgi:chemotaxis protein methyltransferase CheR